MADELRVASKPELRDPVLITAFRGWNDGGQGASLAGGYLAKTWAAARFAEIEPEGFFDFQATRPHVSLVDGRTRRIDWPDNAFYHAHIPGLERDAVLMLGIEPNLRWQTFTDLITGQAKELGVQLVVTLGSLLADVPTAAYVAELEQRADVLEDEENLPSGDTLAAELTRFLRERERGNGGPEEGPSEQP